MDSFIPSLGRFFKREQHRQQFLIKSSLVHHTAEETRIKMRENLLSITERGTTLNDMEDKANAMEFESRLFYLQTLPWYKKWWYWFSRCDRRCCCCVPAWWIGIGVSKNSLDAL